MNVAKPLKPSEYEAYRKELYSFQGGAEGNMAQSVSLDTDPSVNPKGINEKLSLVQAMKDRVMMILNRAILAEAYWKTVSKRLDATFDSEYQRAMILHGKSAGNAEMRKATATGEAQKGVVSKLFGDEGDYDQQHSMVQRNHADATAFLKEVQNIYDNLDSTDQNLSRQLKSVQVNAKVYGEDSGMSLTGRER